MVENIYNRGDVIRMDSQRLKKELNLRASEIREIVKMPGWKYLKEFLINTINIKKDELQNLSLNAESIDDLKKISDIAITIDVYQSILDKTDEFIKIGE